MLSLHLLVFFFFFQAEDGIRDGHVTGVQTCALPISPPAEPLGGAGGGERRDPEGDRTRGPGRDTRRDGCLSRCARKDDRWPRPPSGHHLPPRPGRGPGCIPAGAKTPAWPTSCWLRCWCCWASS